MGVDAVTGLPADVAAYRPDTAVYDAILDADGPPAWLDDLDLRRAPPFHHVGTHATSHDEWLCVDAAREPELELRSRLLDERREVVFACSPTADDAADTTLGLVVDWLHDHRVDHAVPDPREHPLLSIGRLVQEDVCLMVRRDGDWHLDAGVLCFPSMWDLRDRFGLPTGRVHEHVAHYGDISSRVDTFFDRLRPDRLVWRRNLSIKPFPHLHLPLTKLDAPSRPVEIGDDGTPFWIRSERQTLRRLGGHDAIVFTIRIQLTPARALLARRDIARSMAAQVESWDDTLRDYKFGNPATIRPFVEWLTRVAAA